MTELERKLLDASQDPTKLDALMAELLLSKVFILTDKNPKAGSGFDASAMPLILTSASNIPVLAIFTHPDRSVAWHRQFPKYGTSMQVEFSWLIKGVGDGTGLVINPGSVDGMEIAPSGVEQLKKQAA